MSLVKGAGLPTSPDTQETPIPLIIDPSVQRRLDGFDGVLQYLGADAIVEAFGKPAQPVVVESSSALPKTDPVLDSPAVTQRNLF